MRKKLCAFISVGIMALMLAACGSSNKPASTDVSNGKEEAGTTTDQIENNNTDASDSGVDSGVDLTSTPEPAPTEVPVATEVPDATEVTEAPVVTKEPVEPTAEPVPTKAPAATPKPTPTIPPVEDDKPSGWSGKYDNLVTKGFDHIKVPTRDDFNDKGFNASTKDSAFDFDGSAWSEEWYDAYEDFLVANGSPIGSDGKPMAAFNAIHDGNIDGYQYLYYGVNWDGSNNGWGDIILYSNGMHPTIKDDVDYNGAYVLEFVNFTYGKMDKGVEDEYRAAVSMMLSWICSNSSQVEKAIYDTFVEDHCVIYDHFKANGFDSWVQIGDVDVCVTRIDTKEEVYMFGVRAHQ